ncbi:MAG: hypothetical protein GX776_09355 [Oxalobacter sp.]|nr:hypothetical protein [Oxalobacter sp.]
MTPHEAQRTRLFDFAYRFYDRIIGNPPEKTTMPSLVMMRTSYIYTLAADAVLSNSTTRRHRIFSKVDALAKEAASYQRQSNELPDVLAEAVNRTLVRLNLSKAYCEASPARRRLYLAAAEKNRAAFAEKEDAVSQYLFQEEVAVIRGDWKNAMKNLHLIPVEVRPYLLTVPSIRHAKNPMVVAYVNEIRQMINQPVREH